ncbi:hypothetical protein CASFOL_001183 [Castilleja foliolosa]|uniref:Uncharacterized protein n=1 Tax=Castilleja foliolosa TaxID=1961234 RepID=A0ABD3ELU7_9LAMI
MFTYSEIYSKTMAAQDNKIDGAQYTTFFIFLIFLPYLQICKISGRMCDFFTVVDAQREWSAVEATGPMRLRLAAAEVRQTMAKVERICMDNGTRWCLGVRLLMKKLRASIKGSGGFNLTIDGKEVAVGSATSRHLVTTGSAAGQARLSGDETWYLLRLGNDLCIADGCLFLSISYSSMWRSGEDLGMIQRSHARLPHFPLFCFLFGDEDESFFRRRATCREIGKSYGQIAEETGLTNVYVAQLLRRQAQLKPITAPKLRGSGVSLDLNKRKNNPRDYVTPQIHFRFSFEFRIFIP